MSNRNWTPVRNGVIYCSPACGGGCTHEAYKTATKKAEALAKKCTEEIGGEWNIRVHENLGWHWSVVQSKTNIEITYGGYLPKGKNYSIGLCGGTPVQVSTHPETFNSPKKAYDTQIKMIVDENKTWAKILNNASV